MSTPQPTSSALQATAQIEVRFNECDPLGIVWHGNYVQYLEDSREAFGKKYGLNYLDFYVKGFATPIVNMHIDYKRTLQYKDVAIVEATYRRTDAAKIIFDYIIRKEQTGEIVCKATTTQVFVTSGTMELSLVCPDIYKTWKENNGLG